MGHRQWFGRCLLAAGVFIALLNGIAAAQTSPNGVYLGGVKVPPAASRTCVQVQIAGQKPSAYNCLNQQLQQQAQSAQGRAVPAAPLGAGSQSNAVGTFNEQGVREQYGQNFGKSIYPYRPPAPVFSSQLH